MPQAGERSSNRVLTIPNLLSFARILLIPVCVILLLDPDTRLGGMLLLGVVVSTDWVDGYIARRTGTVTELGKLLDPLADRLAIISAFVTFVILEAIPLWAALLIVIRDIVVLLTAVVIGALRKIRIEVRPLGKYATFTLWWGVGLVAWGNLGFPLDDAALVVGWVWFVVGAVEYYIATVAYAFDLKRALAERS